VPFSCACSRVFAAIGCWQKLSPLSDMLTLGVPATPSLPSPSPPDVKTSLMELHDLGPCKLFDTAGLDEPGELGAKKRAKVRDLGALGIQCWWAC
jgi:hypothetical protein